MLSLLNPVSGLSRLHLSRRPRATYRRKARTSLRRATGPKTCSGGLSHFPGSPAPRDPSLQRRCPDSWLRNPFDRMLCPALGPVAGLQSCRTLLPRTCHTPGSSSGCPRRHGLSGNTCRAWLCRGRKLLAGAPGCASIALPWALLQVLQARQAFQVHQVLLVLQGRQAFLREVVAGSQ